MIEVRFDTKAEVLHKLSQIIEGISCPSDFGHCVTVSFHDSKGNMLAGAVYNNFTHSDVYLSVGAFSPRWATKRVFRVLSEIPFLHWNVQRVSSSVAGNLPRVQKLNERLGFKLEGTKRRGLDGKIDLHMYGMLKEECPWLTEETSQKAQHFQKGYKAPKPHLNDEKPVGGNVEVRIERKID